MARKKVKVKDHERLDDLTVGKVVSLLENEKPITKKEACEILNISYNTQRLNKIIENFKERKEYEAKRRKQNRGRPLDNFDKKFIVSEYLKHGVISRIADSLYRTPNSILKFIKKTGLPQRVPGATYWNPSQIPDDAVAFEFNIGELVWAARYNCVAEIDKKIKDTDLGPVYRIWVWGKKNEFAMQPCWELGKLTCLDELGLTREDLKLSDNLQMEYR